MTRNNRNRTGRRGNDPRGASANQQQRQSAGSRDGIPIAQQQSRRGGKLGSTMNKSISDNTQNGPLAQPSVPPPDDHVPIAGFNSDAVAAMLKQGYDAKASLYKPDAKVQTKPESPWGAKRE